MSFKYAGLHLDDNLTFNSHVRMVHKNIGINAYRIRRARSSLNRKLYLLLFNPIWPGGQYVSYRCFTFRSRYRLRILVSSIYTWGVVNFIVVVVAVVVS